MTKAIKTLNADVSLTVSEYSIQKIMVRSAEDLVKLVSAFVKNTELDTMVFKCEWEDEKTVVDYVLLIEGYANAFVYRHKVK